MKNPIVTIEMENGKKIVAELYPEKAPNTVNNFLSLVKSGFYDGLTFHRVIEGFMIQGGDPAGTGAGGPGYTIKGEFALNGFKQNDIKHLRGVLSSAATFKVSAKRSDKAFPLNSMEIGRELGGVLMAAYPHLKVDVHAPQVNVTVEVRDFAAYVHAGKQPGAGGLPVSTSGKAALMLSGGIDSPVAGYMMAKRGLSLTCIHFASPPYTSERARMKVLKLAKELTPYTGNLNVYVVPYTKPQEYIRDNAPDVLFTVLMRRSMLRIANILCEKEQAKAIVTGESLAQVASQTLMALACTDAAQSLPILRPCIGMDKTEITEIARRIGTFETSILPYEDCCTIFTPPHPKTKPTLAEIEAAEAAMPALAELERAAAAETPVEAVCL